MSVRNGVTRTLALLTALAALIVVAGCGSGGSGSGGSDTPVRGGSVVVAVSEPFQSWDGTATFDSSQDARLDPLVAETLVRMGRTGGIEPGIATSWEFSDGNRVVTFHLRKDVKFSNGQPLTADDVVFSFKQGWMTRNNISGQTYLKGVVDARAPDRYTVVFTSDVPNGQVPYALSYGVFGIYPKNWAGMSKRAFMQHPIGAGAFLAGPVTPGSGGWDQVVVTRNPHYYGTPAHLDKITFEYIADPNQNALQFKSGAVDLVRKVDVGLVSRYDPNAIKYFPGSDVYDVFTSWRSTPWVSNEKFRRAISLAINRRQLIEGYWGGHAKIATHVAPEELKDTPPPPHGDWTTYDPAAARQLLAEIGYRGQTVTYDVLATDQGQKILTEAIQQMLQAVGINTKVLTSPDYNSYLVRLAGKNGQGGPYSLANGAISGVYPHPAEVMGSFADYSWYGVGAPTGAAERFRAEVAAAGTPSQTRLAMQDMEQWAYDNTVMVPLAQPDYINAVQPRLKGFTENLVGMWRPEDWYVTK